MDHNTHCNIEFGRGRFVAIAMMLSFVAGCVTPWEKSSLLKDKLPGISGVQGPTERSLRNWFKKNKDDDDQAIGKSLKPIAGTPEYLAAEELYDDEKYEEAQKAFKKVAKKFKKSEIKEDALFMQAESAYKRGHYATAHDAYAVLLKDYPATRHMNTVAERLFKIGKVWLDDPQVATLGEIQQVNYDNPTRPRPSEEPAKLPKSKPIFMPNFRDKQRPLFDTPGNGVAALTAVWMNDPAGPLADDAMMLVASHHARKGNYVEADRFFQNLRELYPNSPHVRDAFVIGAHCKAMCYQGPEYEVRTLQDAELLKKSILHLYPEIPEADRIKDELARMEDEKAQVIWNQAVFYQGKGLKRSSSIYCHEVISKYPKSSYAAKAKAKLVELGPEFESGAVFMTCDEVKHPTMLERVLEPEVPEWMKKPSTLMARRKTPKPTEKSDKSDDTEIAEGKKSSKSKTVQVNATDEESEPDEDEKPTKSASKSRGFTRKATKPVRQAIGRKVDESEE